MKKQTPFIDVRPVHKETISAKEFVQLVKDRPLSIARSRFVMPDLGTRSFGGFEVEYTVPILKRTSA